jgi:hypothetical protein
MDNEDPYLPSGGLSASMIMCNPSSIRFLNEKNKNKKERLDPGSLKIGLELKTSKLTGF